MNRILAITLLCAAVTLVVSTQAKNVPNDVEQALISLDKQQLIADNKATSAAVQNASYTPDEYKFEMLSPDVVVMTHRGTTKGIQNSKEVTDSHRSLHVFQKLDGRWQVVANAQLPIAQ